MGSMNSNNCLSFPLSPTNPSFSLPEIPFQAPNEWNLISTEGGGEAPKVADFLGVSKAENETHLMGFNEIHTDYLFPITPFNVDSTTTNSNSLQCLNLSMGSGKGEPTPPPLNNTALHVTPTRTSDTLGHRTSIYRGVTRHRWTGRYEAHLWDNSCRREGQSRKGRQGYDKEDKAARAYDLVALKYWGTSTTTNFPISNYEKEVEEMKHMTRQEFVAAIRRKSSGFSRGASMYRGVTRHHQHGRWQARIGRVAGNKDLYLGTFSTEEEAAEAYDIAAIKFRGLNAVTNFDMSRYDVKSILDSNSVPIGGGAAKRLKEAQAMEASRKREEMMIALGASSSSSNSSNHRLLQSPNFTQPLLSLQNHHEISPYTHDPASFHHSTYSHHDSHYANNTHPFYGGGGGGDSSGGYLVSAVGMGCTLGDEYALVKVDYDMPNSDGGGYGSWSEDSVQGSNNGGF
ncbi:LOW QUALITY PROTEIN: AP2-like ethylene-responsive transcription factor PLT1 [Cucurbita moschata]|uniref:LOW QUALITY PROTEIN: AP2-like ethylene-responsive transcription factor PLT1 n=1 Tax=Cucurbita moschata TaxID=3662 RepID=A0A6J1H2P2_CUCMO|nr:LOW QUALITY PROTEIN: AP2-like ethylene-responsive transcription factor PLT1 [Cucurbita moschata]